LSHILIVDDNEFNIYTLQKILQALKMVVDVKDYATNGKMAIEKIISK